jgi:hypothetical protein
MWKEDDPPPNPLLFLPAFAFVSTLSSTGGTSHHQAKGFIGKERGGGRKERGGDIIYTCINVYTVSREKRKYLAPSFRGGCFTLSYYRWKHLKPFTFTQVLLLVGGYKKGTRLASDPPPSLRLAL